MFYHKRWEEIWLLLSELKVAITRLNSTLITQVAKPVVASPSPNQYIDITVDVLRQVKDGTEFLYRDSIRMDIVDGRLLNQLRIMLPPNTSLAEKIRIY